jgi:predicted anti-sigma-YlaC factor YlaD
MTCRELTDFIMDYLSGDMSPALADVFERHLKLCPNCRTYLTNYEVTVKASKAAFENDAEPYLPEDLVRAILAASREVS